MAPRQDLPPIAYDDLIERLSDPESDLDHYLQYMVEVPSPELMAPDLEPNPALVTDIPARAEGGFALGLANWFMRRRRHRAYRRRLAGGWTGPRIVSEGDSWFQYPTSLQDIIDHLMNDHAILSLGAAGDELVDIRAQWEMLVHLKEEQASALLLSAGGNDLFDDGQIGRLVEPPTPGASGADLVGASFDRFLDALIADLDDLMRRVHRALPHVHILIHGYGPAFPRGGSWIEGPLTERGVPKAIQHDVVKAMLATFNARLAALAADPRFDGMVAHVDLTDIGRQRSDWHDEIHLNGANAALAAERFRQELAARLTAPVDLWPHGPEPESSAPGHRFGHRFGHGFGHRFGHAAEVGAQARALAALDAPTLLRELDLRVGLLGMDPAVAGEAALAPLVIGRDVPETVPALLSDGARRLTELWESELVDVLDTTDSTDAAATAIRVAAAAAVAPTGAGNQGAGELAEAVANWLAGQTPAPPPVLIPPLAAWLADQPAEQGMATYRRLRSAQGSAQAPTVPTANGRAHPEVEPPAARTTVGAIRARLAAHAGSGTDKLSDVLSTDDRDVRLERLSEALQKEVIEPLTVPVDADGAHRFHRSAAEILTLLGGEPDEHELSDDELGLAEAIVAIDGSRMALYVQDGFVDLNDPKVVDTDWQAEIEAHETDVRRLIASTGRIIRGSSRSNRIVYGTAWMLADGRVATARHVLENMGHEIDGTWELSGRFFVDFTVEVDRPINPDAVFAIDGVDWASPDPINGRVDPANLDAAVLRLRPVCGRPFPEPIPLAGPDDTQAVIDTGWFFNVGYPGQPSGRWLVDTEDGNDATLSRAVVFALIGDQFGVKRLSPGWIDDEPGTFDGDDRGHVFTHDATTLGGSSGSGLMTITDRAVMSGLHFAGKLGTRNYAHFVPVLADNWAGQR